MNRTCRVIVTVLIVGLIMLGAGGIASADYYAARNGANSNLSPYTSWATAASNIHDAVSTATNNATVWVGAGRYTCPTNGVVYNGITNVVYINKPLTLRSESGDPGDVIIDGLGTNRGITIYYNADTSDRFILTGLTVSNSCNHGILFDADLGRTWTGVVENCVITHGASGDGLHDQGGFNYGVCVSVSDTIIRNNPGRGITIYATGGAEPANSTLTDCTIEYNGGGINCHVGTHTFTRCVIRHNDSGTANGGALTIGHGTYYLYDCLIHNNVAAGVGGAIYKWSATGPMYIHNCTIVSNLSTVSGPGGIRSSAVNPICNSIVRFNHFNTSLSDWFTSGGTTFTNSNSTGTMPGAGNISDDPQFVDLGGFDFHLPNDSPCVNTGTNLLWMNGAVDLDGFRRVDRANNKVDMGCYEYPFRLGTIISVQ